MLTATPRGLDVTATPLMTSPGFEPGTQPHLDAAFSIGSRGVTDVALHLLIYLKSENYENSRGRAPRASRFFSCFYRALHSLTIH